MMRRLSVKVNQTVVCRSSLEKTKIYKMKFEQVCNFHLSGIYLILFFTTVAVIQGCKIKHHADHTYCVCDATSCTPLVEQPLTKDQVNVYTSSQEGKRFDFERISLQTSKSDDQQNYYKHASLSAIIKVHPNKSLQKIEGFGGALTDAAAQNILSMPDKLQKQILDDYFNKNGLNYTLIRVPIGGTDFSNRPYALDDQDGDFELKNFTLAPEDIDMKIPLLKRILQINNNVKLFGTSWSAPAWMKTNQKLYGKGGLIGQPGNKYYKTWANYLVKFIQEYRKENIHFWGMTIQNEPTQGFKAGFPFNCMAFSPEQMRDFIKLDLGPALEASGFSPGQFRLFIVDDHTIFLPRWTQIILSDEGAAKYVFGASYHWYMNGFFPLSETLDPVHKMYPDLVLLSTEACTGSTMTQIPSFPHVDLGSWSRGEAYAKDIIENLNHWASGWVDWNLVLDEQGGPNWVGNFVDAPIIVNASKQEYYRQPMFYVLSHFAKFLPPGSVRLEHDQQVHNIVDKESEHFSSVCFRTPNEQIVLIALNRDQKEMHLQVNAGNQGSFHVQLKGKSITTFVWKERKIRRRSIIPAVGFFDYRPFLIGFTGF